MFGRIMSVMAVVCVLAVAQTQAVIVAETIDDQNPLTGGFNVPWFAPHGGTPSAVNDAGTPAWELNVPTSANTLYSKFDADANPINVAHVTDPTGWTYTAQVKVLQSTEVVPGHLYLEVDDTVNRWVMNLANDPDNAAISGLHTRHNSGFTQIVQQDMGNAYNLIQMILDPVNGVYGDADDVMTVYLNTSPIASLQRGTADLLASSGAGFLGIAWGDGSGGTPTLSRWNWVRFETGQNIIPEPASLALLGLGGLLMLRRRRGE